MCKQRSSKYSTFTLFTGWLKKSQPRTWRASLIVTSMAYFVNYLSRRLADGEDIVMLGVMCVCPPSHDCTPH